MVKLTNTAAGPRGVNLKQGGTHFLEPGETVDLEHDGNLYEGIVEASSDEKALATMNKGELLALANDAGVTVAKDKDGADVALADATKAQLIDAIEASRTE